MATQVNVRLDDDLTVALDRLAEATGSSRTEVLREALVHRIEEADSEGVAEMYRRSYSEQPEGPEELQRAEQSARRLTSEEPWEPWW